MRVHRLLTIGLVGVVGLAAVGCAPVRNLFGTLSGVVTATPTRTPRPLLPTFTPTAAVATTTPLPPTPAETAAATGGAASPTPTEPVATPAATPYLTAAQGNVNIRRGPGTDYDVVGQLASGQSLPITGKNALGDWWQVCCVQGENGWVVARLVQAQGPLDGVTVVQDIPPTQTPRPLPPTNTPAPAPPSLPTSTPAPALRYMRVRGPEFYPNTNPVVTIWAKVYAAPNVPLGGRELKVMRNGAEIGRAVSDAAFSKTNPSASFGFFEDANIKFEYQDVSASRWSFCIAEGGACVSPEMPFDVSPDNANRTVYVALQAN